MEKIYKGAYTYYYCFGNKILTKSIAKNEAKAIKSRIDIKQKKKIYIVPNLPLYY